MKASPREVMSVVYVADDDAGMRDSLSVLFEAVDMPCRMFSNGEELLKGLNPADAGCILLDYNMPRPNGLETLKALRVGGIRLPVIIITGYGRVDLAVRALKDGASDFIEKPWEKDVLLQSIKRAFETERTQRHIIEERQDAIAIIQSFTPREKEVFDELIKGEANKVIARTLNISPRTVEFYRSNVLEKSGATSVAELVRIAFRAGLLI